MAAFLLDAMLSRKAFFSHHLHARPSQRPIPHFAIQIIMAMFLLHANPLTEFYGTRYQSGSFSFTCVASGFHSLRSFSLLCFAIRKTLLSLTSCMPGPAKGLSSRSVTTTVMRRGVRAMVRSSFSPSRGMRTMTSPKAPKLQNGCMNDTPLLGWAKIVCI